jgi:hypothetical protein
MKRRMKDASGTAGDTGDSRVAVNVRVRVYPGTDGEVGGLWSRISAIWRGTQ